MQLKVPINMPLKKQSNQAEADQAIAQAIAKAKQERDDMKRRYERKIQSLQAEVNESRVVLQALVLIARMSPEEFFALVESEADRWPLADLKHVAAALQNRLSMIKKSRGVMVDSTGQRLCHYLLTDPKAEKNAVVHVIGDLHKELTFIECQLPPKEIQVCEPNGDDDSRLGFSKESLHKPTNPAVVVERPASPGGKGTPATSPAASQRSEVSSRRSESVKDYTDADGGFDDLWNSSEVNGDLPARQ